MKNKIQDNKVNIEMKKKKPHQAYPRIRAIKKTDKLRAIIIDDEIHIAGGPVYTSVDEIPFLYNEYHKFLEDQEVIDLFVEQGYELKECRSCPKSLPAHNIYFRLRKDSGKLENQCRCCKVRVTRAIHRKKRVAISVIGSEEFIHYSFQRLRRNHISPKNGGVSFPIETFMSEEHFRKIVADAYDPETNTFKCAYTGVELVCADVGKWTKNSPSFDRKDNSKGYEEGNVVLVSLDANAKKGDSTEAEQKNLSQGITKQGSDNEQENN